MDPTGWRMLVCCVMLNASNRLAVDRAWPGFFERWSTYQDLYHEAVLTDDITATMDEIATLLKPTGCQLQKARRLIQMTDQFVLEHGPALKRVSHLPGCGPYAQESWSVFKLGVRPAVIMDPVISAWVELCDELGVDYHAEDRWSVPSRLRMVAALSDR